MKEMSNTKNKSNKVSEKEKWPNRLALYLGAWGILNLFFAWIFGGILIFFAVFIYASKNYKAIYAFGIVYLLLASLQLFLGAYYINSSYAAVISQGNIFIFVVNLLLNSLQLFLVAYYINIFYDTLMSQGYILILFSLINFVFGGYVIYKTHQLRRIRK